LTFRLKSPSWRCVAPPGGERGKEQVGKPGGIMKTKRIERIVGWDMGGDKCIRCGRETASLLVEIHGEAEAEAVCSKCVHEVKDEVLEFLENSFGLK